MHKTLYAAIIKLLRNEQMKVFCNIVNNPPIFAIFYDVFFKFAWHKVKSI